VGGYRDYFDDGQVAELDAMVDGELLPVFGYTSAEVAADEGSGCSRPAVP
jgi:hypothetical protein